MNQIIEALKSRRSCRAYKPEQISDAQLDAVLEAGMYAPTGHGWQAPVMVVIQDKDTIAKLSEMNAAILGTGVDPFYGAPTVIVVLADKSRPTYLYDGSCVMDNLLNAAHAVGLGACWIHRAKEEFESDTGKALLKQWGITGDYEGIGHCVLGYRAGDLPAPPPRREGRIIKV